HGLLDALAAVAGGVLVTQLHRLEGSGRGTRRNGGTSGRAVLELHLDLDGRVATGVQDLAGTNEFDLGHGVAFHIGSVGPGQGDLQPIGRPRRRLVPVTAWTEAVPVARWRSPGPIAGRVRRWGCQSIRLPQVAGPTTPSMSSLVDFWYAFTAA